MTTNNEEARTKVYTPERYTTCAKCETVYLYKQDAETCAESKCPRDKDGLPILTKWVRPPAGPVTKKGRS